MRLPILYIIVGLVDTALLLAYNRYGYNRTFVVASKRKGKWQLRKRVNVTTTKGVSEKGRMVVGKQDLLWGTMLTALRSGVLCMQQRKKDVQQMMKDALEAVENDEYVEPQKLTIGDWLDEWWRTYCIPFKKQSTCTGYESTIVWHIKPFIGKRQLQDLRPEHIQAVINALVAAGKAPSTVRKAHTILHLACEQAIVNGILAKNTVTRIILPKLEQEEIRIFTLEEQKAFIEALPDNTSGRALYFILGTGLRLAELTGLRWSDIHENEFHIRQPIFKIDVSAYKCIKLF